MIVLGGDRRRPRVPSKLRIAEEDAATKPPEVKPTVVRSAFAAISSRFPSEISLQDLQAFVRGHGLGISGATLREMVGKASAKRKNWRARGRDLPLRVMRDTLWVEDVMWALRVRKTRRDFDKWEVNEHRDEWVCILEAATPGHPTVFATSPDHRIAPPLSYAELVEYSEQGAGACKVSAGGSASNSSGRGAWNARKDGATGSTGSMPRPSTTGKMWTPLESRLPKSLLLTSRPGSAAEMGGGDLAGGGGAAGAATGGGTTTVGGGTAWEGEGGVGDSTVWCFPSWAGGRGSSGGGESHGGCGSDSRGGGRSAVANPQGRALFGRKPSPATVARSTSYAPRRRPPCSADGRRVRPAKGGGDDTAELYEMERGVNNCSFSPTATIHLSTTAAPQPRDPVERGAARAGSVTSALTFDDFADVSHANAGTAVAAARAAESSTVAGAGAGAGVDAGAGAETEETVVVEVAEEGRARQRPGKGETLDDALGGDGAECSGGVVTTAPEDGGQDAAAVSPANANRGGPPPSTDASLSTSHHGDTLWLGPARGSASSRLSGDGGEATADRFTPATTAATAISSTSVAPPGLRPRVAVREGDGTGTNGSSGVGGATPGGNKDDEYDDGAARAQRHPKREGGVGGLGEGEGGGAAEWWREALGPTSRRPVTRRSLVGVGAVGGGTRSAGCIWEQHGGGGGQTSDNNCSIVCGGYSGERRRSRGAAPICGFSTESKQRDLEDFLKRRSSLDESEGLASTRVRGWEEALARARTGARFRHLIGRNTIRQNFDQSLRDKACDTLALDLRGHGTHLVAPETPVADESNNNARRQRRPPHQGRCATAGGTGASRMRRRTMTKAWSSSAAEGRKDHSGGVGPGDSSRPPPPFGAVRGTTAQEARIMVVADQVRMWGKCSQAHFGRFEERPYIHSFRPHTSHGLRGFQPSYQTSTDHTITSTSTAFRYQS